MVWSDITLLVPRVISPVIVPLKRDIWVRGRDTFYDSHKCELHRQYSHPQSNREDVELDVWSIVSLGVGVAGIIYAVVTNKRSEKQREELIAKFNHEREIDQQRYEEEKQRAIEANEAQRIRDRLQREKEEQREIEQRRRDEEEAQRREQERFEQEQRERQRQYEAERNRDYLRRSSKRSQFDAKDTGWDATVTDNGNMITISNLSDTDFIHVVVKVSDHDSDPWFGAEVAHFSSFPAHSGFSFPGKPTFNDIDRVTIDGFPFGTSAGKRIKVPLAPEETMWDYRGGSAYDGRCLP